MPEHDLWGELAHAIDLGSRNPRFLQTGREVDAELGWISAQQFSFEALLSLLSCWPPEERGLALETAERRLEGWADPARAEFAGSWEVLDALLAEPGWRLVRHLTLFLSDLDEVERLANRPELATLSGLTLRFHGEWDEGTIRRFIGSPHLGSLRSLELDNYLPGDASAEFARAPLLSQLRHLGVHGDLGLVLRSAKLDQLQSLELSAGAALVHLLDSHCPPKLQSLWFIPHDIDAATALGQSSRLKASLKALTLAHDKVSDDYLAAISSGGALPGLEHLILENMGSAEFGLTPRGAQHLARLACAPSLTRLDLGWNLHLGDEGWEILSRLPLTRLRELNLSHTGGGDLGAGALSRSTSFADLQSLDLGYNELTGEGLRALSASDWLPRMTSLGVYGSDLRGEGVATLVRSPAAGKLRYLGLGMLDRDGATALAQSPQLTDLEALALEYYDDGESVAEALARSAFFPNLVSLNLANFGMADGTATALANAPNSGRLRMLALGGGDITESGMGVLCDSRLLSSLWGLYVGFNPIGDAGAFRLAQSPFAEKLVELTIIGCGLTEAGSSALANSRNTRRLRRLIIGNDLHTPWRNSSVVSAVLKARLRPRTTVTDNSEGA